MASQADKNKMAGSVNNLKNKALYLEKIPVLGPFFKAARENVEGQGPGTNKFKSPAQSIGEAMAGKKKKK